MKRTKSLLTMLLFSFLLLLPFSIQAADMEPVTTNTPFTGQLEDVDATHYYSFTVDKSGYFNIEFSITDVTVDTKYGWTVSLHRAEDGTKIYETKPTAKTTLPTFNFKEGTELYLFVQRVHGYTDNTVPVNVKYSINIKMTEDTSWEQEDNDTAETAAVIKGNTTYNGNLYHYDDEDFYKYTITQNGSINLNFAINGVATDVGYGWSITVYNEVGEQYYYETTKTAMTFPSYNFQKGTTLLFKVARVYGYTDNTVPRFVPYSIKVAETPSNYWESENFIRKDASWDTKTRGAASMELDKNYYGNLWKQEDHDFFKMIVPGSGYVTMNFLPTYMTSDIGCGYTVLVYSNNGTELYDAHIADKTTANFYLDKGTYYIEIHQRYGYTNPPILKNYAISTSYKKTTPAKVSGVKAKKNKISWKKASNADGYQVIYSLKKNFKGKKTVTTTKKTCKLSKLKKGKKYFVKVRAYKTTATGSKVYGSWSKIVKAKKK